MSLPDRNAVAEDAFVQSMQDAPHDEIVDAVVAATGSGRPLLAARLVGLLPESVEADEPAVARARRAGRLLLLAPVDRRGPVIAELEEAVMAMKARFMDRARARQRKNARDVMDPTRPRRKPRGTGRG